MIVVGTEVVAEVQITEELGRNVVQVFAQPGEVGEVVDVLPDGWVMVAWDDGVVQCDASEISPLEATPALAAA